MNLVRYWGVQLLMAAIRFSGSGAIDYPHTAVRGG